MGIVGVSWVGIDDYANLGHRHYPTGNGVDSLANMAGMGIDCAIVGVVGTDAYGDEMYRMLAHFGIDATHLHRIHGETSLQPMQLVGNDRVHLKYVPGVSELFALSPEDHRFIKSHAYVHTDISGGMEGFFADWRAAGCRIVFDFSTGYKRWPGTLAAMAQVDYAFLSYTEDDDFIRGYLKECFATGGPTVVTATLGEHGSISYDGKQYYRQQATPVKEVVNTVGAGDAFIAGFMTGVMRGLDIPGCMALGTETSTRIIQMFDPYPYNSAV